MKGKVFYLSNTEKAPKPYHYRECGLDYVFLMNGYTIENYDGEECVSIKNVDGLWKAIGLKLCTENKTLSAREVRFLRRVMNKTQSELAEELRVSDQTVARWEKGTSDLDGPADIVLRMRFFLSDQAQPEGLNYAQTLISVIRDLSKQDEQERPLTFTRKQGHWAEAPRECVMA